MTDSATIDRAADSRDLLDALLRPRDVAVVGASRNPASLSRTVVDNLLDHSSHACRVWLVGNSEEPIRGHECHATVADLPVVPDVALLMVPSRAMEQAVADCASAGVRVAIIFSSGFAETGSAGQAAEERLLQIAASGGMRIYGPNCPGLTNLRDGLGMSITAEFRNDHNPGPVALITQGGGLGRTVMQSMPIGRGVGVWISPGNAMDLGPAEFVELLSSDSETDTIGVLLEGVNEGRRLLASVRTARAAGKRVVVLKLGRSAAGLRAAMSHTASRAGRFEVARDALRSAGAVVVEDVDTFVQVMALAPVPNLARGLAILTFSGGAATLAADVLGEKGLALADFTPETRSALEQVLPKYAQIDNPVDLTGQVFAEPSLHRATLEVLARAPEVGGVVVPMVADYGETTEAMATDIVEVARDLGTPILPVWLSRRSGSARSVFQRAGLQDWESMKALAATLCVLAERRSPTPVQPPTSPPTLRQLDETEAKEIARVAGLATPAERVAATADEAVAAAQRIGFPVALKVVADIAHKSDVGGVRLDLRNEDEVRAAHAAIEAAVAEAAPGATVRGVLVSAMVPDGVEVVVGLHRDPGFGPVISVGAGGVLVDLLPSAAHRPAPVTAQVASELIDQSGVGRLLTHRGRDGDVHALRDVIQRLSEIGDQRPDLEEFEANPVRVLDRPNGAVLLDALATLAHPSPARDQETT